MTPLQILAQSDTEERFYMLLQILLSAIQDTNRPAVNIVNSDILLQLVVASEGFVFGDSPLGVWK